MELTETYSDYVGSEELEPISCSECPCEVATSEAVIFTDQCIKDQDYILCPTCAEYEQAHNGFPKSSFRKLI